MTAMQRARQRWLAVVLVALCGAPAADALQSSSDSTVEDRTITLADGTPIHISEFGRGPLMLVLHGGPSLGRRYLVDGLQPLRSRYRVVVYDQRGIGQSGAAADSAFGFDQLLNDIGSIASRLGADRFALVGHSWGATLALAFAMRDPARIDRLVLVSPLEPGRRYSTLFADRLRARTGVTDSSALRLALQSDEYRRGSVEAADVAFRAMYRPWFGERDSVARLRAGFSRTEIERSRATGARLAQRTEDLARWVDLPRVRTPTLIVHGTEDPIPMEVAVEMSQQLPNGRLVRLPGVGHFPMLERPIEFSEAILRFVSR